MPRSSFLPALALASACAAAVAPSRFQNRDAWTIDAPRLRVTIMQSGGHVAELVLKGGQEVNPLWIQSRRTIDPERYVAARDEKFYGGGSGARLMSGLLGHNVCFPFWGDPSPSETVAGMTYHGETGVVRWRQVSAAGDSLTVTAELPESHTRFTRTVRVRGQVAYFEETAENETAWDRPVGWCEHVTLGPPFLERGATVIDASLTRGRVSGDASGREFRWPQGFETQPIDLRRIRGLASSPGFVNDFLVDPARQYGFFAALQPKLGLLVGYVFPRAAFPWLNIWEANNAEMFTRGMEFSNTPVHGTMKVLFRNPSLWGLPTFEWLDAKSRLTKRYCAFSLRVPQDYKGVADVRIRRDQLEIVERETGKTTALEFEADRL
ncbi:MAG TPA: hypothetical protein VFA33_29220 [Bryobacteraceae bacterium]|nr:hypothetical protein [Bryobacteraceae bacterium]